MKKLKHLNNEVKVLRDPVHEYIHVNDEIIWNLIDAKEFQRLRRIRQLGGTYQVYHGAEHSRFSHSLGVYEIARRMIEEVEGLKETLSEKEQIAVKCAALLHDVGHGPFSQAFESVTNVDQELMSVRIILGNTEINQILSHYDHDYPQMVADIIDHQHENKLLTQIMSAQMDADRMDYLLRDSYFTGVSYGEFDLERILRTLRIKNNSLVIKESGIHALEDYIMARYQMYWQVYLHPTSRSFEVILLSLFQRMRECFEMGSYALEQVAFFKPFLSEGEISLRAHYELDESACNYGFMKLTKSQDPILADLSRRLLNRDLFQYEDVKNESQLDSLGVKISDLGFDPNYYCVQDFMTQVLYTPYEESGGMEIRVLVGDETFELSRVSSIVRGFVEGEHKEDHKVFFPREVV